MKVAVLGSGGWGTALSLLLLDNGHRVTLWSHDPKKAALLRESRANPMLPGVNLPVQLDVTDNLEAAAFEAEMVVSAVPSFAVEQTAKRLSDFIAPRAVVVSVSKGIERDSGLRLSQVIENALGKSHPVAVLCGPSHAEEVALHMPTACVAASPYLDVAQWVQDAFMNERFRVYTNLDTVGVEFGAAMKNIYALCCGICDGLGYGDNTRAMLMTRGLTEMARLGVALGGHKETFGGLTGVGDLIVTCTSMHSRNRRAGILIGQGVAPQEAMERIGAVVEGYYAAKNAYTLAERMHIDMPIANAAYRVLYQNEDVEKMASELMCRSKKHEIEESWV